MTLLTHGELLANYKTLIELVADLKAEKEVYIEAKREVYEHPQSLPKNFDSTAFSSHIGNYQSERAQRLLEIQKGIDHKIALVDKKINDMLEIKKQIDFLLGLQDERS